MKIAVSFISSKHDLKTTINKIEETDAEYLHVDIMDGEFVTNKNFSPIDIYELLKDSSKKLDVHLMCKSPSDYYEVLSKLNTECITIHKEIDNYQDEIMKIKKLGIKAGIAINPSTDLSSIVSDLENIDAVLVMSVVPGMGGQKFISDVIPKVKELKELQSKYNYKIHIDGGINNETINQVNDYVDLVVSGSYICKSDNYQEKINTLR